MTGPLVWTVIKHFKILIMCLFVWVVRTQTKCYLDFTYIIQRFKNIYSKANCLLALAIFGPSFTVSNTSDRVVSETLADGES